jgi:osmoprotectant transport system ATP-binding protein
MITLEHVSKGFAGGSNAVRDLSLEIPTGQTCVLLGPSGCGKTTTLRMINRLIEPDGGRILVDGVDTLQVDPVQLRLKMGYVIQQTGLFPHMTVADNVATVPRLWEWDAAKVKARVDELLELVGLPPREYRKRYPHQLSGGQRQRVGFARALGADPPILLMDEPFGAVDRITRERLQHEFISIQRRLAKTVVFVTHDIDEAVMVGDRICLMKMQAEVAQYDTPDAILTRPASEYVSEFLGRERLVRRMSIEPIHRDALEHPAGGPAANESRVPVTSTLSEAFGAALTSPTERAAVFDGDHYIGSFSATSLLESLRRDVPDTATEGGSQVASGV